MSNFNSIRLCQSHFISDGDWDCESEAAALNCTLSGVGRKKDSRKEEENHRKSMWDFSIRDLSRDHLHSSHIISVVSEILSAEKIKRERQIPSAVHRCKFIECHVPILAHIARFLFLLLFDKCLCRKRASWCEPATWARTNWGFYV